MNSCSSLTLILACVICWQAKEISGLVHCRKPESGQIEVALLEHVSPIEWDNVILYGQSVLDRGHIRSFGSFRHVFTPMWSVPQESLTGPCRP